MTHPITPPPELVAQWVAQAWHEGTPVQVAASDLHITTQAAQWGADQELKECCLLLDNGEHAESYGCHNGPSLRVARRPKPRSLKEQALEAMEALPTPAGQVTADRLDTIRRALEQLNG